MTIQHDIEVPVRAITLDAIQVTSAARKRPGYAARSTNRPSGRVASLPRYRVSLTMKRAGDPGRDELGCSAWLPSALAWQRGGSARVTLIAGQSEAGDIPLQLRFRDRPSSTGGSWHPSEAEIPDAVQQEPLKPLTASWDPASPDTAGRHSDQRLRYLLRALAEIVWVTTADGRAIELPDWCSYTGQSPAEARDWGWLEAVHPADRQATASAWSRALECGGETPYDVEYRVRGADGSYRWFNARGVPILEPDGSIGGWVGACLDIDARRVRAERSLRDSERRFRATFEQAAVGIAHVGIDGRWLRVNQALCHILGYPREELSGLTFQEITHPDDLDADLTLADQLARGEVERYTLEKRYVRGDGSHVWAALTGSVVRTTEGAPDYFIAVVEDISQRKELEARLKGAERHLRAVMDSMFAFVGVLTPGGDLIEANRAALEAASLQPEDVLNRPFEEAYWWAYDPAVQRQLREAIDRAAAGHPSRYDVLIRLGPDRLEPIDFMIAPLRNADGRITHLVPSAMIITQRVEAEAALRESEARFRTLADNIPQLAWMADATGSIFWYNRRWLDYTGSTLEDMHGWGWQAVHHPDWVEPVTERFRSAIERGEPWEDTFPLRGADGTYRWFLSRALPIKDSGGRVQRWFGTNTDVTQQREEAAERERLYRGAQAASEAKSEFMATMSHELRTPLNAIIGYADLLDMGVPGTLPGDARQYVQRIRLAATHQKQLIEDVLMFNRLEAGQEHAEPRMVNIGELVNELTAVISPLAEARGLRLELPRGSHPEQVHADARKLRQILVNLLGNAVKFTQEGTVSLRVEETGNTVRFEVGDTGIGLHEDQLEVAFDPFWQADRSLTRTSEGSGLGLAISRRFARSLGGDIVVSSEPGQGSTFTLVLPRPIER
jgi:PAS domain S-box-containing protein